MEKYKILIVEDDIFIAENLRDEVLSLGHTVCKIAHTVDEATTIFEKENPDLAILDIELGSNLEGGIDVAEKIQKFKFIPIIFCTGYLRKKNVRRKVAETISTAIMSKGYDKYELEANINKAIYELKNPKIQSTDWINRMMKLINNVLPKTPIKYLTQKSSFWVTPKGLNPTRIKYNDICYVKTSEKNFIFIQLDNKEIMIGGTLNQFAKKLNRDNFMRIHQSHIVNLDKITNLNQHDIMVSVLVGNKEKWLNVSQSQYNELRKMLEI